MFKKELDKTGKGIASMSDQEKKNFFNKIDKMYKAKNEITAVKRNYHLLYKKQLKTKNKKKNLIKMTKVVKKSKRYVKEE